MFKMSSKPHGYLILTPQTKLCGGQVPVPDVVQSQLSLSHWHLLPPSHPIWWQLAGLRCKIILTARCNVPSPFLSPGTPRFLLHQQKEPFCMHAGVGLRLCRDSCGPVGQQELWSTAGMGLSAGSTVPWVVGQTGSAARFITRSSPARLGSCSTRWLAMTLVCLDGKDGILSLLLLSQCYSAFFSETGTYQFFLPPGCRENTGGWSHQQTQTSPGLLPALLMLTFGYAQASISVK